MLGSASLQAHRRASAPTTAARPPAGTGTAVALLVHSVLTNRRERSTVWYLACNAVSGAALIAEARRQGLEWTELGLHRAHLVRGLGVGLTAAAAILAALASGVELAATHPAGQRVLSDRRAALARREVLREALVRIPIGTAAFEEIAFRGVLHGLVADRHGRRAGLLASSATFGLFHIAPTLAALRANGISSGRVRACVAAVALTFVAGLAFGRLRLAGGHVVAPWVVHWAVNAASLAAAARWQRAGDRRATHRFVRNARPASWHPGRPAKSRPLRVKRQRAKD